MEFGENDQYAPAKPELRFALHNPNPSAIFTYMETRNLKSER